MIYNILKDPFAVFLPENILYCKRQDIDRLHRQTCNKLGIIEIYPDILWSFTNKLRNALAEAIYWTDEDGTQHWQINYDTRRWIAMGSEARKNTIIHEICHLAIEKIYGHNPHPKKGEIEVKDHGSQWQSLMHKCGEDPFQEVCWKYK